MNIFPRKSKAVPNAYYFGEFGEKPLPPFSVSIATLGIGFKEKHHFHKVNQKVYITLSGEGSIKVEGKSVTLKPEVMVHVEPMEIHFIEKVTQAPLQIVVVNSSKVDDKVVVEG